MRNLAGPQRLEINTSTSTRQQQLVRSLDDLRLTFEQIKSPRAQLANELKLSADRAVLTALHEHVLEDLERTFNNIVKAKTKLQEEKAVLDSLRFETMQDRYHAIKDAHSKTFKWIFEPNKFEASDPRSRTGFDEWLQSSDSVFWVSGKPGSGKSTLMKYLRDCPQTQSRLQRWAGDSNLVLAAFYFWRSGTELQCSQRGLLRQLLYEILRASPETIWDLCLTNTDTEEWSLHRLHHVYLQLTTINLNAKLCLFIDGLDEYKGEHLDLSQIINSLASIPSVKLCVSSRRWPCFEDAFGGNASRKIYLEELTRDDIYQFADSRLSEIRRFEIGPSDEQQYLRLVSEITEKAEGVFLW